MLMLTKHLDGRHVAVTHETVTVRRPGAPTEHRRLREGELGELLRRALRAADRRRAGGAGRAGRGVAARLMSVVPRRVGGVARASHQA